MKASPFDNLPPLSQEEALELLATPVCELQLSSDYYKAAFHLMKYPGEKTEKALIDLVESTATDQAVIIARRKAVEGLARLGCVDAIPVIGSCLNSSDPYLVENAAWALKELGCEDGSLHSVMISLLDDPRQNRRVLIQSLTDLGVVSVISKIKDLLNDVTLSVGVRGASIVAMSRLAGADNYIFELEKHLIDLNQNNRHCAVEDVINGGALDLLPAVLRAPVAPSFRMRAISALWPDKILRYRQLNLIEIIDQLIIDDPNNLNLVHYYDSRPTEDILVDYLFGTDFSRSYLAVKMLCTRNIDLVWLALSKNLDKAKKDYGALYFFLLVINLMPYLIEANKEKVEEIISSALSNSWPPFMKFKPIAIFLIMKVDTRLNYKNIAFFLDEEKTPFWASRYAALLSIEDWLKDERKENIYTFLNCCINDSNRFVNAKREALLEKLRH